MKTLKWNVLVWGCGLGMMVAAAEQPAERPADKAPAPQAQAAPQETAPAKAEVKPAETPALTPPVPDPAVTKDTKPPEAAAPVQPVADGERGLLLNFRGVPLELVLNYLAEAAGLIIVPEVPVTGKVDVWANQKLTKEEAVQVLDAALKKNGFAAIRDGRTLTIVPYADVMPVVQGSNPSSIPATKDIVTQIIPVRFVDAPQLIQTLQPLLPSGTTLSANQGANAIVVQDTRIHIRRMAEIIKALDTSLAATNSVKVFPLIYADAKTVATMIGSLFQNTGQGGGGMPQFGGRGGGGPGGGPGGPGGFAAMLFGGGNRGGGSSGSGRLATPRVVAVADDRSNSLVVMATEEQMVLVEQVIANLDVNVEDITEVRVFHLKHADPQQTADQLASLFPNTSTSSSQGGGRGQIRFGGGPGGGFFGPFGMGGGAGANQSDRQQKQSQVTAVPDLRTGSVIVSAARNLMEEIGRMIEQLDSDPAGQQGVFVYKMENTDPQAVATLLQTLIPQANGNYGNTRMNSSQQNNPLSYRANQRNQGTGSGFGNSGFGTGSGMGGGRSSMGGGMGGGRIGP